LPTLTGRCSLAKTTTHLNHIAAVYMPCLTAGQQQHMLYPSKGEACRTTNGAEVAGIWYAAWSHRPPPVGIAPDSACSMWQINTARHAAHLLQEHKHKALLCDIDNTLKSLPGNILVVKVKSHMDIYGRMELQMSWLRLQPKHALT
jgi:hypothetical protein